VRVGSVTANRRGILGRLGSLTAPTGQAAQIAPLLTRAMTDSVQADVHYENWLRYLQGQPACSKRQNSDFAAAQREDGLTSSRSRSAGRPHLPDLPADWNAVPPRERA
jgi:hypothetical protein